MTHASAIPPMAPSQVLPGLSLGASLCRPSVRPTMYWHVSLSLTVAMNAKQRQQAADAADVQRRARQPQLHDGAHAAADVQHGKRRDRHVDDRLAGALEARHLAEKRHGQSGGQPDGEPAKRAHRVVLRDLELQNGHAAEQHRHQGAGVKRPRCGCEAANPEHGEQLARADHDRPGATSPESAPQHSPAGGDERTQDESPASTGRSVPDARSPSSAELSESRAAIEINARPAETMTCAGRMRRNRDADAACRRQIANG